MDFDALHHNQIFGRRSIYQPPSMFITHLRLQASTWRLISVLTFGSRFKLTFCHFCDSSAIALAGNPAYGSYLFDVLPQII